MHAHAELWLLLLIEQLAIARPRLSPAARGTIVFELGREHLGAIRLDGRSSQRITEANGDCTVAIDPMKIGTFFDRTSTSVAPGTFTVFGRKDLFDALLQAIESKPARMSWLQGMVERTKNR